MATDYTALDQALDAAIQQQLGSGGTGPGGLTPEQIAAYYGTGATAPKTGLVKELGKAVGRGTLGIPKLAVRAAQGGALDIGQLLGYTPEQNVVAQALGQSAEAIQGVQQKPTLAPSPEFAQEHPIAGFVTENIEGALPWIAGSAASKIPYVGPFVLPAVAGLSSQAESVEQQMKRGVSGTEALKRSIPGAATQAALFAAMPAAMRALKGAPSAALESGVKQGLLPSALGRPGGVVKGAVQGLAADAPYLYGQGEAGQAVGVAAGAITPEEWKQAHTPEAISHAIGSSLVGGAGFGALGGIGQKRAIEAKQEEYRKLHQPIVDDKTPVDLNEKPVVTPNQPLVQQEFPFETTAGPTKPLVQDILPEGEVVLPHTQALKIAAKLKKAGVTPIIEELGIDVTGNKVTRVSLQEQPARELGTMPEQLSLNFGQEQETLKPVIEPLPIKETPATEEISKPEDMFEDMPEDLKEHISDFMTNPNTTVDVAALSQIIGVPEETLLAKRNEALGIVDKSTLATGEPEADQKLADDLGVIYNGNQEGAEGEVYPLFTDNVTGTTLMLKPGDNLSERLIAKRELFKQGDARVAAEKAAQALGETVGKETTLPEVQKKLKELVGEATPETEAEYLKKTTREGWEHNALADEIGSFLHEDGLITNKTIESMKDNLDRYDDVPSTGKNVPRQVEAYKERAVGVLDKAEKAGIVKRIKQGFVLNEKVTPEAFKEWFKDNIYKKRGNAGEGLREAQKESVSGEGAPDHAVEITKADQRRMVKAEAERAEVVTRAQKPHTIFKARMKAFAGELTRIDSEIAKLPSSAKKSVLRRDFTKANIRFKTLIKEGNFTKLKEEAKQFYDKLDNIKTEGPESVQIKTVIDDLKSQARDIGRLELDEKLNKFREGVQEERKVKDLTGIERVETAEGMQYRRESEKKFLQEMSTKKTSDAERIENADDILDVANASNETRTAYEAKKTDKQKSLFLKNLADKAWMSRDKLEKTKGSIALAHGGGRQISQLKEGHAAREVKSAKELERESKPELKASYKEQQEKIRLLKEKQEAKIPGREEAKAHLEKEAKEKIELEKQRVAKEKADQEEKKELQKKIENYPEDTSAGFEVKLSKKGEVKSNADVAYAKFAKSTQTVGSTNAVPEAAHKFVSHLADKFGLDKTFIVTESDLKNSNIKDASITAKKIYAEDGDYIGELHSTVDGIDFLALNDSKIGNEKTLVSTLSHEIGHAIIDKHFEGASAETKQAIEGDFKQWLDKLAQGDSKAINELYQESQDKSWEDFKKEYSKHITDELASGGFKVNEDSMFHEYLAEQIAKYIKVTESAPKGILARFFNTLADKINYILRFANKEFAKNHTPIQSVSKWLDGFKKQGEVTTKKNVALKKKTMVTYDDFKRVAKQVHGTFSPNTNESVVKNMTDLMGASLADKGIVKQAYKGVFRLPWWVSEVRPAAENYEKSLESNILLKQFLKATSQSDKNVPGIISLKDIENKYNKLSKTSRESINKLLVEGDKENIDWASSKDIKSETLRNIPKEDFEVYRQVREFVNQGWRRELQIQSDTLAYGLTKNIELQDRLGSAIRLKEIDSPNKLRDFLESQSSIKAKGGLNTIITPKEFALIADAIYSKDGIKDFYKEYSQNYSTKSLPGYIPRERLDGAEWIIELHTKEGTKIFNQGFYTKAEAQRIFEDLKKNPEKYAPKGLEKLKVFTGKYPTKGSEYFSEESLLAEPILRPITANERFNTGEDKLIADNVAKVLDKFEDVLNKEEVVNAVRKEVMKHLLAQRGMQNRIQRSEQLIEGYNEDSPLDAIQTALDRSAYRQSKMRYIIDQSRLVSKTTDVQHKNAIREYINRTLEPAVTGSTQVQVFKNMAAVYFMGFRPLTALMQLAQLHTVGAAELGMHLKTQGIGGSAQGLLAKAELDMRLGKLSGVEKKIIGMAEERGVTWETSSQAMLFKDVDAKTSQHFLGKRVVKVTEIALKMFQYMEQHNRQSSILAAYRVFSKGSSEFSQEAFDKSMEYNNNTNFMMNKGNVPYWAMKNPVGMSAYTLMSYTLNMANWMLNRSHGSLSDLHIDKWTQRQAFMKMLGYTTILAGVAGAPFADDLNKLIRKIFGRDLHLETKQFIKQHAGEDLANLVADGVFAPLGVNVSANVAIRVPFLSGLLDDKTVGESVSGAAGALVQKGFTAVHAAATGQGRKFVEAASPEVIASALRAERLYREGQRTSTGKPVYFEGKPVKSTGPEALLQGLLGVKSERRANIMRVADSEYKLHAYWTDKKKIAESKARRGDISALQDFNRQLMLNKNARMLVKPLKISGVVEPNKEKTAFELAQ